MQQEPNVGQPEAPIVKTPVEARQGLNRPNMFYVLVGGLVLAMIAFLLMFKVH
jgi:hypothetical protein